MQSESDVAAIAHVIELAVAPVFLLAGVGALLGVLTARLARIIDRARRLEDPAFNLIESGRAEFHHELRQLSRRARLINRAVSLCTICALLVCAVIAALFLGELLSVDVSLLISVVFVGAMLALFVALLCFLREIHIATQHLRIGPP